MTGSRAGGIECRKEPRRATSSFVLVHVEAHDPSRPALTSLPGTLTDLSAGGAGLVVPQEFAAGDRFRLEPDEGAPEAAGSYVVVHCRRIEGSLFKVGARRCEA
jgi:hypothetical protein